MVWDGEGDIFSEYTTYELSGGAVSAPGFSATKKSKGIRHSKSQNLS